MSEIKNKEPELETDYPEENPRDDNSWTEIPEPLAFPERRWKVTFSGGYGEQSVRISLPFLVFLLLFLLFWLGLTVFLLFGSNGNSSSSEASIIKQENLRLQEKLKQYEAIVDSISVRLEALQMQSVSEQKGGGDYPYVPSGASNKSRGKDLESRFSALDVKLQQIMTVLNMQTSAPEVLVSIEVPEPQSGDGIPCIYPTFGMISSDYGLRIHPIYGELLFHDGIDFFNEIGTPIYATADGVVRNISYENGYGKRMFITHSEGYETHYAHLYSYLVKEGDVVRKGQIIALMGNSGLSTGPHLHYEVIDNGYKTNPRAYLNRIDTTKFAGR